jgi:hypothetical protein
MKIILNLFLIVLPITACANSLQIERRDYILSKPHGWISLSITDLEIPNILDPETKKLVKPSRCYLSVLANSEMFLSAPLYPDRSESPYSITSGFRFPIPTGPQNLEIEYSGCKASEKGSTSDIKSTIKLNISNDMVYEIKYASETFSLESEIPDEEVTLKEIYEAVKK